MTTRKKSKFISAALLVCAIVGTQRAEAFGGHSDGPCFSIHVRLNGKAVDGPRTLTIKTKDRKWVESLEGGCFKVPPDALNERFVDILFQAARSEVHLSSIMTGFFAGPWDIDLEDKHFGKGVILPKHAKANQACAVTFHVGEPERAMTQVPCRTQP